MKRLFGVKANGFWVCKSENPDVPVFFDNKVDAKKLRDDFNKTHSPVTVHVAPGPDHKRYNGGVHA